MRIEENFRLDIHGHIITGDLQIIENRRLRKLLTKGPNFRPSTTIRYDKCKKVIEDAIESFIEKLSSRNKLDKSIFNEWKTKILQKVSDKIRVLKIHKKPKATKPILKDPEAQSYLSSLHLKNVIVPIDKAGNNVAFVCKSYYVYRILLEIGICGDNSDTYCLANKDIKEILENIQICRNFGLELKMKNVCL